ncbi:MAG: hypothetical protein KAV44_04185 [Bacteroidales bacterium]|nr:hypothetical protein [Bacteroidales bacterium]
MNKRIEITYDRNFDTLLFDSIEMLFHSLDPDTGWDFRKTLARSSMLNSILLLELSANICIESLELEGSVFNEIIRLPTLGKFDFFLRTSFRDRKLERGISQIEGIKELKRLRDGFVHMKPHKVEWEMEGDGGTAELDKTYLLGIPKNPNGWDENSSITTMQAVHSFLKYFFKVKCKFSAEKVGSFLLSDSKVPGKDTYPMPLFYKTARKDLMDMGIDLKYIKLAWA